MCCDGGFAGFLGLQVCWVSGFAVDYRWIAVVGLHFAVGFLIFFFFILRCSKHYKIFSDYFPECNQTQEKNLFSLKSFTFTNILRWKMIYSETNGA
jgi:hypothetical protein